MYTQKENSTIRDDEIIFDLVIFYGMLIGWIHHLDKNARAQTATSNIN